MKRLAAVAAQVDGLARKTEAVEAKTQALTASQQSKEGAVAPTTSALAETPSGPLDIPERTLGDWMSDRLRAGDWDREATEQATDEAEATLAAWPDLEMEELECGKHFCRASFSVKEGSRPVHHVFGEPPFVGEGFTVPEKDGYVALFFNRGGAPLDDLRRQAFAATQ